jgi:hypothetical protein
MSKNANFDETVARWNLFRPLWDAVCTEWRRAKVVEMSNAGSRRMRTGTAICNGLSVKLSAS